MYPQVSPRQLIFRLTVYFAVLIGAFTLVGLSSPEAVRLLPISGNDAIEAAQLQFETKTIDLPGGGEITRTRLAEPVTRDQATLIALLLCISLGLTVVIMLPITWTYAATRREAGFRKTFVRALIALPICATTIVLLIQNNLALAFGLAALVAAIRFRVSLQDPIDGIYIFAAICVGLAAGIGYIGIATVMAIFFCFANAVLWLMDYGRNPLDEAQIARDRKKLEKSSG